MQSDLDKFLSALIALLREMREQLGAFGVIALGLALVAGIVLALFAWRWIKRGGLSAGATQRFFAERRETERWLRRR